MCRLKEEGGRRCPSHSDPIRRAIASATQCMTRWERRYEAATDPDVADHALARFTAAINTLYERSKLLPPPPDDSEPAVEPLDPYQLRSMDMDDLEDLHRDRTADPDGQRLIEREWSRREMLASPDHDSLLVTTGRFRSVVDNLHIAEELSDRQLKEAWLDGHDHPHLRELAEAEMDRRMLTHAEHPADDPDLESAVDERLEYAWSEMNAADYRRYEASLITDPAARLPEETKLGRRPSSTPTVRQLRADYDEYCYERYLAAEEATRGHLLNKRGRLRGVDPFTLLSGNAQRVKAYGSQELLGFLGSSGGHMSFARYRALHTGGDYDRSRIEEFTDAVSA